MNSITKIAFIKKNLIKVAYTRWKNVLDSVLRAGNKGRLQDFTYKLLKPPPEILPGLLPTNNAVKPVLFTGSKMPMGGDLKSGIMRAQKEMANSTHPQTTSFTKQQLQTRLKNREFYAKRRNVASAPMSQPWSAQKRLNNPEVVEDLGMAVSPDTLIDISHGGTHQYLKEFTQGIHPGYRLERGGLGIQVGTIPLSRESYYANRAAGAYGGTPAQLTGKIPAKYLDAAPNLYEAGLRPEHLKHVQDMKISPIAPIHGQGIASERQMEQAFRPFINPKTKISGTGN